MVFRYVHEDSTVSTTHPATESCSPRCFSQCDTRFVLDFEFSCATAGLVLLECASGKYPYGEASAQIAMVMTVTEGEVPLPPRDGTYTPEFHDLLEQTIAKDPKDRAGAMELLESPWYVLRL